MATDKIGVTEMQKAIEIVKVRMFPDGRMDVENAERYTGIKRKTLAIMRSKGVGPRYVKRGRIFYFKEDLDRWLAEGSVAE